MSKTNDKARAERALRDVIGQGLQANHPTRKALQERLDRYASKASNEAQAMAKAALAQRPLQDFTDGSLIKMTKSRFGYQRMAARVELFARQAA